MTPRPSRMPPSSFRNQSTPGTPVSATGSRPPSRTGAAVVNGDGPLHFYEPGNPRDPLDMEVATIVNSLPHNLLVERVDPPLRSVPKEGEEIRAQYAFSNALARKVVTCKLTTLARSGAKGRDVVKKVMCRVGGGKFLLILCSHCSSLKRSTFTGWQDLQIYVMSRQV